MTTTVNIAVGPPPQIAHLEKVDDQIQWTPNPQFFQWINLMWKWSTNFGNNANASIGGFQIGGDYIRDIAGTMGLSSAVTVGNDIRFWAGSATPASAPARIYENGDVYFGAGTFAGDITTTGHVFASGEYNGGFTTLASVTGSSTSSGDYAGVYGISSGSGAVGSLGYHTSASSPGRGVEGRTGSSSATAYGVKAVASKNTAIALRVFNEAFTGSPVAAEFATQTGTGSVNMNALTLSCGAVNGTTIPASSTLLTNGGALGTPASGTLTNCTIPSSNLTGTALANTVVSSSLLSIVDAGGYAVSVNGNVGSASRFMVHTGGDSGGATANFASTTKPGSNSTNAWIKVYLDGTLYYMPIWT